MVLRRRFQYETLLRIRTRQEDLKAQALAVARREVRNARDQREQISLERERVIKRVGEILKKRFDADEIRRHHQYERYLSRLGDAKDAHIRQLEEMAEGRRAELEEATKRKRVVEKLKARHTKALSKHLQKIEQRLADEAGTTQAVLGLHRAAAAAATGHTSAQRTEREAKT